MSKSAAIELLQHTAETFQNRLAGNFRAFLVYGSVLQTHYEAFQSDLNTILIVDPKTTINEVRRVFLPLWHEHRQLYRRAPLVAREDSFTRYLAVFPAFNNHLNRNAWLICQKNFDHAITRFSDPLESKAFVANELFLASTGLATAMKDEKKWQRSQIALNRLKRRFKTPVEITDVQSLIMTLLKRLSEPTPDIKAQADAPYNIQGLVALYEKLGDLIFIVENPEIIEETDWDRVSQDVEDNGFTSFSVTTPDLFRLLIQKIYPLDTAILSYHHVWGTEILTAVTVPPADVLRDAARLALAFEIDEFPNKVLTSPASSDENAVLIHDFQNKLLNIRLQNELLARLKLSDKSGTGRLPDKNATQEVRLQGIWDSFGFWGSFFYDNYASSTL